MRYRKKPVIIEAFKWTASANQTDDPEWIVNAINNNDVWFKNNFTKDVKMVIKTLEGDMAADVGDYIIKGVKGEIYPCKSDIFEMTYELVAEE